MTFLSSTETYPPISGCFLPTLPATRGLHVSFMTAGVNPMLATCGGNDKDWLSSCLVLNATAGRWEEKVMGPLLRTRGNHAVATLKNVGVYIIGGEGIPSGTTEFLASGTLEWQQGPTIPFKAYRPCAVSISSSSFIVVYGSEVREFDASIAGPISRQGWGNENKWPKLKTRRIYWPGCALVGQKVIIAGGYSRGNSYATTEILDLTTKTIVNGVEMALPRRLFHIHTVKYRNSTKIFALGGKGGDIGDTRDNKSLKIVEEWNPETEMWRRVQDLSVERYSYGIVAAPVKMICPK